MTVTDRKTYSEDVLSLKTHLLGDSIFVDGAEGVFTPITITGISRPVYKFKVKVTGEVYSQIRKAVDTAFQLIGGEEVYNFVPPEDWKSLSFSQQDEVRFTDQYQKTGTIPVWNPTTNRYMVPRPVDNILSSREYRLVSFHQVVPPKVNGYTEGESLDGLECTVEARFRLLDNGNLYLEAKAINIYSHN
jgi:hypothetical protein